MRAFSIRSKPARTSRLGVAAKAVLLALAWGSLDSGAVQAQGQGQGRRNAPTVVVSRLNDLSFGIVVGGTPVLVRPEDPTAAHFEVKLRGRPPHVVTVTLALPRELTSGPNRLPIRFDGASAAWATPDAPDARTIFDPAQGATITLDQRGPKSILVWIGGVLEPTSNPPSGDYTELITLSAVEN